MCKKQLFFTTIFLLILFLFPTAKVWAQSSCPNSDNDPCASPSMSAADKVSCYENLSNTCSKEINSLSSQIQTFNSNISLTSLRISQTQQQIVNLTNEIASISGKIDNLEGSLNTLSNVLIERIIASYKNSSHNNLGLLMFSSGKLYDLLVNLRYLQIVQRNDQKILLIVETTKVNYTEQKKVREQKKQEQTDLTITLAAQKKNLENQQQAKKNLLAVTKNDEQRYQSLLNQAKKELQDLITSKFSEKRHVNKGDIIGLMGSTGFSTGPHLHFGVYNLSESNADKFNYYSDVENPLNYLSSKNVSFDAYSCDDVSSSQSKNIGSGSWNWPMNDPTISQCFGHTPYSYVYPGNFHHGLDMYNNQDIYIRAVEEGEAYFYRGQQGSFGNNARIFHSNGKMTLYLHMQ